MVQTSHHKQNNQRWAVSRFHTGFKALQVPVVLLCVQPRRESQVSHACSRDGQGADGQGEQDGDHGLHGCGSASLICERLPGSYSLSCRTTGTEQKAVSHRRHALGGGNYPARNTQPGGEFVLLEKLALCRNAQEQHSIISTCTGQTSTKRPTGGRRTRKLISKRRWHKQLLSP